jgi:PAS domain S-box-containing protein
MDFNSHGREKFEYILDNIPDAITIVDNYGKVIFFNSTAEEYFNLKKSDIIDKDLVEFFPNAILLRVLDSRTSFNNIYNSPRENSFVVSSAVPLYDREGKMIGALARDRDITEIVRLSELLNKTRSNLLRLEQEYSKMSSAGEAYFSKIVSNNAAFIEIINLCKNISKTPLNILLKGESGTGKELFAKAIHYESGRKGKFIPINCSAIPRELFESEIFGYEAGAFTGAKTEGKKGKFEEAEGGTIFLDEIADLPLELQPKLLRILEDGVVTRIGGNKPKKIDVRIISATNKDIRDLIDQDKFRKDLYYRLDIFQVSIPPLRERKGDIPLLANRFLQEFCMEQGISIVEIPEEIQNIFFEYKWEGNVRELRNVIQRSAIIASQRGENKIKKEFLPSYMQNIEVDQMNKLINLSELRGSTGLEEYLGRIEKRIIIKTLEEVKFNKAEAAKKLKIPRGTLYYKMEKYGIK